MKKRIVSILLVFVMLISIVPYGSIVAMASTTKTKEQAMSWLSSLVGTKVGSGQCVALIKAYYEYLGAPTPYGNGCDYATNSLPTGWQRIKGATPQTGDILIWTQGYQNYGHVAVCGGSNKYYHQNWGGYYVQVLSSSYTNGFSISSGKYYANYWGVIRPDFKNETHTHNYNTYAYYWAAHPHYKCYKCSCGAVKENRDQPTFVSTCKTCNPTVTYKNITAGNYFIRNKNGGYLNVAYSKDEDKATIHTHTYGNYDAQVYNIYKAKDGYEMMPLCSKTRVVNPYSWTVESGKTVNLYSKTNESSQWWKFQPMGDGYVIRNVQNPNVCLTPYNYSMIVSEYTGADNQIWYLEKACIVKYNASGGVGAPSSQRVRAGYKAVLSAKKPTKQCCKFLGWSTAKNDTIAAWDEKIAVTIYDDTTLYAVYEELKHSYKTTTTKANTTKNGSIVKKCTVCGKVASNTAIKYAKTFKLSTTAYTYNGKAKTPTVTIKNSAGQTLKNGTDYTVIYARDRKKVGKYKVTVKFKGNYSGTKTLYFNINPKATSVKKVTAAKKSLKVSIAKQTKEVTGYEIQYSTSKKFKPAKKATVKKAKTTSATIKKLKAKKTYYIRVRTYKTVKGKKYYSGWSKVKVKKTK